MKRWLGAITLLCVVGCQAPGTSKWAGTWKATGIDYGGDLRCVAQPVDSDHHQWRARFSGYCGRQYVYDIAMTGRKEGDTIQFEGEADLGEEDGGVYHWTGELAGDVFAGRYKASGGKTGTFRMTRQ